MSDKTLTDRIFSVSAPYSNPYQGPRHRILFVCSAGLLRSPTGAHMYADRYNTRSCGAQNYALIPLSANLLRWADYVVFVQQDVYDAAEKTFKDKPCWEALADHQKIVLNIPDRYPFMDKKLRAEFKEQLTPVLERLMHYKAGPQDD